MVRSKRMITHYILHLYLNYIREKSLVPREILVELAIILMVNLLMKNIGVLMRRM